MNNNSEIKTTMTWKEFKEALESQGMNDDTEIYYIETYMKEPTIRMASIRSDRVFISDK